MLPHAGNRTRTRTWREVVGLGAELAAFPDVDGLAGSPIVRVEP